MTHTDRRLGSTMHRLTGEARVLLHRGLISVGSRVGLPVSWGLEWAIGLYEGDSLTSLVPMTGMRQPILTARDVTDTPARFLADPFWVRDNGEWFLFMEVLNARTDRGVIGLATSPDGRRWRYRRIVLEERFHQSYPCVFRTDTDWYMTPSGLLGGAIRLYRALEFPDRWTYVKDLVTGPFVDPTVLFYDGRWWLFAGVGFDRLHLFSANEPMGDWAEHPASPLRTGDLAYARPGGRIVNPNGRLIRFAQDCRLRYGHMVHAFEIIRLTSSVYVEHPLASEPILVPGAGWNQHGMHHIDPYRLASGRWVAIVDGWRARAEWRSRKHVT